MILLPLPRRGHGNLGHQLNGHHLLEFSTAIDNQTKTDFARLKIRVATLWMLVGQKPNAVGTKLVNDRHAMKQQHRRSSRSSNSASVHTLNSNFQSTTTSTNTNTNHQLRKRKRKRKKKDGAAASISSFYYDNHNFNNHIINSNNDGNHIISNSSQKKRQRHDAQLTSETFRLTADQQEPAKSSSRNTTLWIFRIRKPQDSHTNLEDKVSLLVQSLKLKASTFCAFRNLTRLPSLVPRSSWCFQVNWAGRRLTSPRWFSSGMRRIAVTRVDCSCWPIVRVAVIGSRSICRMICRRRRSSSKMMLTVHF